MTDLQAIEQYRAASDWWAFLFFMKQPRIFWDSREDMEQLEERRQRRMRKAERTMRQAERALASLPRKEWRDAMIQRYILQRNHLEAAEVMNYSETSVRRFEQAAIDHLKTRERLKAQKAAESPANRF